MRVSSLRTDTRWGVRRALRAAPANPPRPPQVPVKLLLEQVEARLHLGALAAAHGRQWDAEGGVSRDGAARQLLVLPPPALPPETEDVGDSREGSCKGKEGKHQCPEGVPAGMEQGCKGNAPQQARSRDASQQAWNRDAKGMHPSRHRAGMHPAGMEAPPKRHGHAKAGLRCRGRGCRGWCRTRDRDLGGRWSSGDGGSGAAGGFCRTLSREERNGGPRHPIPSPFIPILT